MKQALIAIFFIIGFGTASEGKEKQRAGVGKIDITPQGPIWMSGYASRNKPSEGVLSPLYAKALALEDGHGGRAVLVTTDLIGLPREVTDIVSAKAMEKYKLERSQLVFNSSHTHTGPVVRGNLSVLVSQQPEFKPAVAAYTEKLKDDLLTVIGAALGDLSPAALAFDYGEQKFAANRRVITPQGVIIGVNPNGPVDHRVPVLRVTSPNGKVKAVLFAYSCHNTTLTGEFYQLSGDYAGYAQAELERQMPGTVGLFMMLCGGDQNPSPRSKLEYAQDHGKSLGGEAVRVARGKMPPVSGRLRTAYQLTALPFAPHTREQFEKERTDPNIFKQRRAEFMLKQYDEHREERQLSYPVQAIRFDKGFTLFTLGGEVVVDYALWAQREWPAERLMVAGYSNDVAGYIPTARILKEGGYEPVDSMIYYGHPGPFTAEVETRIHDALRQVKQRTTK
ncbi:MAG: neutral/alkaline non-lysosomal ceramidase N-terminal domain-containing protein [Acidobacteria bacterium]|nr:neutral/alkaline non-lysosomal ceramidase N-terminal domain-containing protein [Acidobacteriota bacterium]